MPRRQPKQERSRAMVMTILDAATRVLEDHQAALVSTNRIAEVAGISIGSLYQYFTDKDEIVQALWARHHRQCLDEVERVHAATHGYRLDERLHELFVAILRLHRQSVPLHVNGARNGALAFPASLETFDDLNGATSHIVAESYPGLSRDRLLLVSRAINANITVLVHSAIQFSEFAKDSVVIGYFEAATFPWLNRLPSEGLRNPRVHGAYRR